MTQSDIYPELPWLSAGPLPPRRRKAGPKRRSAPLTTADTASSSQSPLNPSIPGSPQSPIPAIPLATPLRKLPPKSWSDLLKPNGHAAKKTNGVTNGIKPHSFTTLAELTSRYNPRSHSDSPLIQPRGLINKGNMCFMNAVLQVLVFCPPFYNLFDRIGREVPQQIVSHTPLMDAMVMFIREFQLQPEANGHESTEFGVPFAPDHVYQSMRGNPRFNSMQRGHQEDAEEFLGFLLDGLHEEFLKALKEQDDEKSGIFDDAASSTQEVDTHNDEWLEVGKHQKIAVTRTAVISESPISRMFGGHMRSILKVGGAKDSITLEPYQPLQLDIQSPEIRSITDALASLPEPELLSEDWTVGGLKVRATKQVFIESLPPVLILHLKRFLYDNVGGTQKSWKQVGYPLELDIPVAALSPARRGITNTKYRLIGVVYHHGLSASGGHYTVDVLRQDGKAWIHLDDTNITQVSGSEVAIEVDDSTNLLGRPNRLAYIILYGQV